MNRDATTLSPRSRLTLQDDETVLLEHRVEATDTFDQAANELFVLLREAQRRHPGGLRFLRLTVDGHTGERAGYDDDLFELQQEFLLGAMGRFFTWIETPLTGKLDNSEPQENDMADRLRVDGSEG